MLAGGGLCPVEVQVLLSCRRGAVGSAHSTPRSCHNLENVLLQWLVCPTVVVGIGVHVVEYDIVGKQCGCLYFITLAACGYVCTFRRGYSDCGTHHTHTVTTCTTMVFDVAIVLF